jgi:hypothetical protein
VDNNQPVTEMELKAHAVAPRVTPEQIKENIEFVAYTDGYDLIADACHRLVDGDDKPVSLSTGHLNHGLHCLTICVITLKNGFTVVGTSAPASPTNFSAEIGQRLAYQDAFNKLWPLFGFELKQRLYQENAE